MPEGGYQADGAAPQVVAHIEGAAFDLHALHAAARHRRSVAGGGGLFQLGSGLLHRVERAAAFLFGVVAQLVAHLLHRHGQRLDHLGGAVTQLPDRGTQPSQQAEQ